jgi:hypothetical protein
MPQYRFSAKESVWSRLKQLAAEHDLSEGAMLTLMINTWKSPYTSQPVEQADVKPSKPVKGGSLADAVARYKEKNQ